MRERLHLKKCKRTGRTQPKITHEEVEQKCYNGLSRRQNALYKNKKYDDGVDTRTNIPAHMEEAKFLEHMLNEIAANLKPNEEAYSKKTHRKRNRGKGLIMTEGEGYNTYASSGKQYAKKK